MYVTGTSGGDGSGRGVFVQQMDANKNLPRGPQRVAQEFRGSQWQSDIALLKNGNFVVTWQGRGDSDRDGVFIREFNSDTQPLSSETRVSLSDAGLQRFAAVDASTSGVTVTWHGKGNADHFGVYSRFFPIQTAPVATDFNLGLITQGTKLTVDATDIISEFGTDVDSILNSMSVSFAGVKLSGANSSLANVGFNYMAGAGTSGGFMINTFATAFSGLDGGETRNVVIDFVVSDGLFEDTGKFTFSVIGGNTEIDQANFQFEGESVVNQGVTASAGGIAGQSNLDVSLTDYSDISEALSSVDFRATPEFAINPLLDNGMLTVAAAFADESSTANASAINVSQAFSIARIDSETTTVASNSSVARATSSDTGSAQAAADESSVASAEANVDSTATAVAAFDSGATATATETSDAQSLAENGSAAESAASDLGSSTATADGRSNATATSSDSSTSVATADAMSSATAFSAEESVASADAESGSISNAIGTTDSAASASASLESDALANATNNSAAEASAHDESSASASADLTSNATAVAEDFSTTSAQATMNSTSDATATAGGTTNAASEDNSEATAVSEINSAASAVAKNGSNAIANALQGSAADSDSENNGIATTTAENSSVANANGANDSTATARLIQGHRPPFPVNRLLRLQPPEIPQLPQLLQV